MLRRVSVWVATSILLCARAAYADEPEIALGDVSLSAPDLDPAAVRTEAEGELKKLARRRGRGRLVVSLAVRGTTSGAVDFTVSAVLSERRTGKMIAILESRARADGPSSTELRSSVMRAAVKSAVLRISDALPPS